VAGYPWARQDESGEPSRWVATCLGHQCFTPDKRLRVELDDPAEPDLEGRRLGAHVDTVQKEAGFQTQNVTGAQPCWCDVFRSSE
jgi:hypothetical protein